MSACHARLLCLLPAVLACGACPEMPAYGACLRCWLQCLPACLSVFLCVHLAELMEFMELTLIGKVPFVSDNRQSAIGNQ
jgi:hypothetical protein